MTQYRGKRPPEISHWQPDDAVRYQSVEFSVAASHAEDFVIAHAAKLDRPGWTIIVASTGYGRR